MSEGRIQGLSATLLRSHLAGSRNKEFYSPLDGCGLFTWRGPEFCPNTGYKRVVLISMVRLSGLFCTYKRRRGSKIPEI